MSPLLSSLLLAITFQLLVFVGECGREVRTKEQAHHGVLGFISARGEKQGAAGHEHIVKVQLQQEQQRNKQNETKKEQQEQRQQTQLLEQHEHASAQQKEQQQEQEQEHQQEKEQEQVQAQDEEQQHQQHQQRQQKSLLRHRRDEIAGRQIILSEASAGTAGGQKFALLPGIVQFYALSLLPRCHLLVCILFMIIMSIRWSCASRARLRLRDRLIHDPAHYFQDQDPQGAHPLISLIMPVKMAAVKSSEPRENWKSQVLADYAGPLEAIFCVESAEDAAVPIIESLKAELEGQVKIKIAIAGLTRSCSQKIHNMIAGIKACDSSSEYVFFLDANCRIHPASARNMAAELQKDPSVFAVTGYPLDIPPQGASLWAWAMVQFRYVTLSEFSNPRSDFIWGGAMMLRTTDSAGEDLLRSWSSGGYSDDHLVMGFAAELSKSIATPLYAIFPNHIKDVAFSQMYEFFHRQVFVLTTYHSAKHLLKHIFLMLVYFVGNATMATGHPVVLFLLINACIWPCVATSINFIVALSYIIVLFAAIMVNMHHINATASLINHLGDKEETKYIDTSHVSFLMMLVSFIVQTLVAPIVVFHCICDRWIVWGGIRYHISSGRVDQVCHPDKATIDRNLELGQGLNFESHITPRS